MMLSSGVCAHRLTLPSFLYRWAAVTTRCPLCSFTHRQSSCMFAWQLWLSMYCRIDLFYARAIPSFLTSPSPRRWTRTPCALCTVQPDRRVPRPARGRCLAGVSAIAKRLDRQERWSISCKIADGVYPAAPAECLLLILSILTESWRHTADAANNVLLAMPAGQTQLQMGCTP